MNFKIVSCWQARCVKCVKTCKTNFYGQFIMTQTIESSKSVCLHNKLEFPVKTVLDCKQY